MRSRYASARRALRFAAALGVVGVAASQVSAATLTPITGFGGGDGWRAPFEVIAGDVEGTTAPHPTTTEPIYRFLGNGLAVGVDPASSVNAGNLERGMAYNPASGNLLVVSRNAPNGGNIRILNGTTGADIGSLDQTGVSGGNFSMNMIGVADDGAIYLSNLSTNLTSSAYKIYRWESEQAVPTVVYNSTGSDVLAGARLGDSFDVFGSGANTQMVAGYGVAAAIAGTNGFVKFATTDGLSFTSSNVAIAPAVDPLVTPASGEFQYGITFKDSDTIIGKSRANPATVVDVSGTTGTVVDQQGTDGISMRLLDFAVVDGKPLLATLEASGGTSPSKPRVMIYDMSNPALPLAERKIAEASALPAALGPNANASGQIKFGAINGKTATLYAMSTNNGIQAFTLSLETPVVDDADFNGDGVVDGADFLTWQTGFGLSGQIDKSTGDADGDGNVNDADLAIWTTQFGTTTTPPATVSAVPEPATLALAAMGVAGLAAWRRRK